MKIIISVLAMALATIFSLSAIAQNLVPNPSFEDFSSCPDVEDQVYKAIGWNTVAISPDYYNACATISSGYSVPSNLFGYQYAASGQAYIGLYAKEESNSYREYVGSQLIDTLQIGTKYFVSLKVNLSPYPYSMEYCGVNKLGVLFSTVNYHTHYPAPLNNYAQVFTDSIITDTLSWVAIKGSFVSDSAYSFISIGNFFNDSFTDSIQVAGSTCFAYYFIDDICVSTDSTYCSSYSYTGLTNISKNNFVSCYPNPVKDFVTIEDNGRNIEAFKLYDINGQLLISQESNHSYFHTLNLKDLPHGIYNLMIQKKIYCQLIK